MNAIYAAERSSTSRSIGRATKVLKSWSCKLNFTSANGSAPSRSCFSSQTHEVFNQSGPFENVDLLQSDLALKKCTELFVSKKGCKEAMTLLSQHGKSCGSSKMMTKANEAEKNRPVLEQFDVNGRRQDVIMYHQSYHDLMSLGVRSGVTNYGYNQASSSSNEDRSNKDKGGMGEQDGHLVRAGLMYIQNQVEPGHCCPLVMTSAAIPILQQSASHSTSIASASAAYRSLWLKRVLSSEYDPRDLPIQQKSSSTIGMSMTEKQGGSDVRANTTTATRVRDESMGEGEDSDAYLLKGHKWFTSAPMSDAFLTLAKVPPSSPSSAASSTTSSASSGAGVSGGIDGGNSSNTHKSLDKVSPTCFLVPRWTPGGSRNEGFKVMRLKNKMADRANASSEVEYDGAYGLRVGEEGKGIQMVQMTRLDCTLGAAGGARRAVSLALNHCADRSAFGLPLVQQPMMQNVLAELCLQAEACTLSAMRMAAAHARSHSANSSIPAEEIEREKRVFRVGVAIMKYYCTKAQPQLAYECMEIFGGNGFVEEFPMAKLFRHSPLNSIWEGSTSIAHNHKTKIYPSTSPLNSMKSVWEGSGNVMALDVLRAGGEIPAFLEDLQMDVRGQDQHLDAYCDHIYSVLRHVQEESASGGKGSLEGQRFARYLCDRLAIAYQASLFLKVMPEHADAFIAARIRPFTGMESAGGTAGAAIGSNGLNYGSGCVFDKTVASRIIEDNMPRFF